MDPVDAAWVCSTSDYNFAWIDKREEIGATNRPTSLENLQKWILWMRLGCAVRQNDSAGLDWADVASVADVVDSAGSC